MTALTLRHIVDAQRLLAAWRIERGLTANEAAVALEIFVLGAVSAAELSRVVGISTASMSRLLGRLESAGWIVRSGDMTDGRRLLVQPSKHLVIEAARLAPAPGRDDANRGVRLA